MGWYDALMQLHYDEVTKQRLRAWQRDDQVLFRATEAQLRRIEASPHQHGVDGTPHVPRLVSYSVPGRDDEFVITWDVAGSRVGIISISSSAELEARAQLRRR